MITVHHESWVATLEISFPETWQKNQKWLRNMCTTPNYQRTSMFIGHFALTPERWSIWAEIWYWGSYILRLGLVRISAQSDQKNVGYPEDRPLCKGTEKQGGAGSSRWKFVAIPTTPSPWFWSSWEPSSLQITICKGTAEHRGGRIMWMISCNNLCFSV